MSSIANKRLSLGEFTHGVPTMGGMLWLDLVNSRLVWNGEPVDHLAGEESFRNWVDAVGIDAPSDLESERRELVLLRQLIASTVDGLTRGETMTAPVIEALNRTLARISHSYCLHADEAKLQLKETSNYVGNKIAPLITEDFARFIVEGDRTRIKHCENPQCSMVFHDFGKNNRRRWCSTTICGNRDKVARYRKRQNA